MSDWQHSGNNAFTQPTAYKISITRFAEQRRPRDITFAIGDIVSVTIQPLMTLKIKGDKKIAREQLPGG